MSLHDTKRFVYFSSNEQKKQSKQEESVSKKQLKKLLETLSNQAIKEKAPNLEELELILQNSMKQSSEKEKDEMELDKKEEQGLSITKFLKDEGYLRDEKNWLTNKAFIEVGGQILNDVMQDLSSSEFGLHETNRMGNGSIVMDSTRKFEPGDDMKFLSVSDTILNSIQRISKSNKKIEFPISMEPEDLEQHETFEDVRVSVVYCIDLSSTMKYSLGKNGKSRIQAAKKALWSLYVLNKKFFPNDSIAIVGFASMATIVKPLDIPFLKTFDANDNFLHYTNYQAAFKLARKLLQKSSSENKRIVMITDGQPSACFIENEFQKNEIISEKPYSNFYAPDESIISKIQNEKNMKLDTNPGRLVYLCYRYKKVDPKISHRTLVEAKLCKREGIAIDTIVVGDEKELLEYAQNLEKDLKGKTYHINQENMDKVLVNDYLYNTRKVLSPTQTW